MEGLAAPVSSEESLLYEQRHSWLLHGLFLAIPLALGGFMFVVDVAGGAETMERYDLTLAEMAWAAARIALRYPIAAGALHGVVTSLILRGGPWTIHRVATVHAGVVALWALLAWIYLG